MSKRKLFGTDGIRGKANVYPMTGDMAFQLGRAVTHHFQLTNNCESKKPLIIVGKDTRLSCYMLEQAFAAGVCSQGGEVILTGPLPTPGVAFVTKSMRADAGVMISASHNPFSDNGIKIFDPKGFKLPDEVELKLEKMVLEPSLIPQKIDGELGNAKRLKEVFGRYIVHCKNALDDEYDLEGMRVVLDGANGAGYKVAPMMFSELGAEVLPLGVKPNGQNINLDCGSLHPEKASALVNKYRADIGICLDGDADRCVIIDENGAVVDGDKLIALYAKLLLDQGVLKKGDTVVGTIMSNLGLENQLKDWGLKFHRTQVGDRYIIEYMKEHKAKLGGEPSGHIIFTDHGTTGDGAVAGLKMIEAMKFYKKKVSEMVADIKLYPQVLKSCLVAHKPELSSLPKVQDSLKKAEKALGNKGRVILRYSGTEPKIRVMIEGEDQALIDKHCGDLLEAIQAEIG
ncbi:MAG: phosphoglucosamine mutase [Oligoflexia bacterium]|nr:phosphoglucosamine mutase [Oligoflexia bacterium]